MRTACCVVLIAMTLGLVVSPCIRPGSAQALRPTRLLFVSSRDSADRKCFDIFTMKPDGTAPVNLTKSEANEFDPAWAPDGRRIAFVVFTKGASPTESKSDLFVMNADGSARKQLTQVEAGTMALSPSWTADGERLAYCVLSGFGSNRPPIGFIETMKLDGSEVTRLRDGLLPAWSPDGMRILFTVIENNEPALHVMEANGGNPRPLLPAKSMLGAWSPDGSRIACMKEGGGDQPDLFVMDADGSNMKQLTMTPELEFGTAWSPDGKRIFTTRMQQPPTMGASIWSYEADGSGSTLIGDGSTVDFIGAGGVFLMRLQ